MKTLLKLSTAVILLGSLAPVLACAGMTNSVRENLPQIQKMVRDCVTQPYTQKADGTKVFGMLKSHCLYVKVTELGKASLQVGKNHYNASLIETANSDGDFYHVQIQDLGTGDTDQIANVLAYGDILLGILDGNVQGIDQILETM